MCVCVCVYRCVHAAYRTFFSTGIVHGEGYISTTVSRYRPCEDGRKLPESVHWIMIIQPTHRDRRHCRRRYPRVAINILSVSLVLVLYSPVQATERTTWFAHHPHSLRNCGLGRLGTHSRTVATHLQACFRQDLHRRRIPVSPKPRRVPMTRSERLLLMCTDTSHCSHPSPWRWPHPVLLWPSLA